MVAVAAEGMVAVAAEGMVAAAAEGMVAVAAEGMVAAAAEGMVAVAVGDIRGTRGTRVAEEHRTAPGAAVALRTWVVGVPAEEEPRTSRGAVGAAASHTSVAVEPPLPAAQGTRVGELEDTCAAAGRALGRGWPPRVWLVAPVTADRAQSQPPTDVCAAPHSFCIAVTSTTDRRQRHGLTHSVTMNTDPETHPIPCSRSTARSSAVHCVHLQP